LLTMHLLSEPDCTEGPKINALACMGNKLYEP
jgi:hypothetical protein